MVNKIILILGLMAVQASAIAFNQQFIAPMETGTWQLSSSRLECRLSQTIPAYGEASFIQKNADMPRFQLTYWQGISYSTDANLYLTPPAWQLNKQQHPIGKVAIQAGKNAISFPRQLTEKLLAGLNQGLMPVFNYLADGSDITVKLSPIDFGSAYPAYMKCVGSLLEFSFEEVDKTIVRYPFNGSVLGPETIQVLDRIRDYVLADPDVLYVKIEGYSDNKGRKGVNNFVSERRAKAIQQYLLRKGVPKEKIKITWYGANKPEADNETESGRQKNRRVAITIVR